MKTMLVNKVALLYVVENIRDTLWFPTTDKAKTKFLKAILEWSQYVYLPMEHNKFSNTYALSLKYSDSKNGIRRNTSSVEMMYCLFDVYKIGNSIQASLSAVTFKVPIQITNYETIEVDNTYYQLASYSSLIRYINGQEACDDIFREVELSEYHHHQGRWYSVISSMKKQVRNIRLKGFYEMDIESAQPTIMLKYFDDLGYINVKDYPFIYYYITFKSKVRVAIANKFSIPIPAVKNIFNQATFGAKRIVSLKQFTLKMKDGKLLAFTQLAKDYSISHNTMLKVSNFEFVVKYYKEITNLSKVILEKVKDTSTYTYNLLVAKSKGVELKDSEVLSIFYQQIESQIIQGKKALLHSWGYRSITLHDAIFIEKYEELTNEQKIELQSDDLVKFSITKV